MCISHEVSSLTSSTATDGNRAQCGWTGRLDVVIAAWRRRARTRRQLSGLNLEQLADVGITWQQATIEANKPFWRA